VIFSILIMDFVIKPEIIKEKEKTEELASFLALLVVESSEVKLLVKLSSVFTQSRCFCIIGVLDSPDSTRLHETYCRPIFPPFHMVYRLYFPLNCSIPFNF
jgi:hypothetical protein